MNLRRFLAPYMLTGLMLPAAYSAGCDTLAALKLSSVTSISATAVDAGGFTPAGAPANSPALAQYKTLPGFCRVQGVIEPSKDSHIEFEVWLPASGWNTKYLGVGNGGFAGSIAYPGLADAVRYGYAGSSTDTGHKAGVTDARWALSHPERVTDFGYRAIHETALKAKAIVKAFYGSDATKSYFSSCSNGGRQGLMEAQRFPDDYDGIVAGAPAGAMVGIGMAFLWDVQALDGDGFIPETKLPAIEAAAIAACDALDGVKDGVIDDPRKCKFDPMTMLCASGDSSSCLTQAQAAALKKIYSGPSNSSGAKIFSGFFPGGETGPGGWRAWVTGTANAKGAQYEFATGGFQNLIFDRPDYDFHEFSFDRDVKRAEDKLALALDATNPDLSAFRKRGGRLIMYHGWSDAAIPAVSSIDYYQRVAAKMGEKDAASFTRLYLAPGMQHCGGGPGPNYFSAGPTAVADPKSSMFRALEQWSERGTAPDEIIATKFKVDANPASGVVRTRPLCKYPEAAVYKGSGSTDEAANFACEFRR